MSNGQTYVKAESVFARTALEMVAAHGPAEGAADTGVCARCAQMLPCAPVRNAIFVLEAAGLPVYPAGSPEARRIAAEAALGRRPEPAASPTAPAGDPLPSREQPTWPDPSAVRAVA